MSLRVGLKSSTWPLYVERYRRGWTTGEGEVQAARARIVTFRERLSDLSWFMRGLNEPVARWANAEEGTQRFWEGRFKSRALFDEAAILTCMSYIALNPVGRLPPRPRDAPDDLPFAFHESLELVDWAGRATRDDKRRVIDVPTPAILVLLGIDPDADIDRVYYQRPFLIRAIARAGRLREAATELGQRFIKGISEAKALFPVAAG